MTSARSRVQAISYTSATNPERAAAAHARLGLGLAGSEFNRGARRARGAFLDFWSPLAAGAAEAGAARGFVDNHKAPVAVTRFSATPIHVVPRSPSAGISQNPAAIAPNAAPVVLAAYRTPASAAERAHQPTAI